MIHFEQRQRRAPNEAERRQIVQRYVEDEALYREGLRLSLVQTDPMLRAQLIARVRGMLQSELEMGALAMYWFFERVVAFVPSV